MAELVTVYKALADDVHKVVRVLHSHNLHPAVLDDADKMGAYRSHAQEIRIAVPQTERDVALGVLAEMERRDATRLAPLLKVTNGVVLLLIGALGLMAIVGFLDPTGKWSALAWIALTVVVAYALLRWAWRRDPKA